MTRPGGGEPPEKHRVRSAEYAAKIIIGKSSNMDEEKIDAQNESERLLKEAEERAFKKIFYNLVMSEKDDCHG